MNPSTRLFGIIGLALLALQPGVVLADDTEIYVNNAPDPGDEPMVMFSLDYRPNLGATACQDSEECAGIEDYLPDQDSYTFFDVLRAVLKKVMEPLEGVKVGLMINHDNINNCAGKVEPKCSNGGYIARGFETFYRDDDNGAKAAFHQFLADMPVPQGVQSHTYQGQELFFEFYRYLSGQGIYNGHVGYTDFYSDKTINLNVETPLISWDTAVEAAGNTTYLSPLLGGTGCGKIFTVNILFQVSSQEDDSKTAIKAEVASGGMALTGNPTFPNVIQWLRDADLADGTKGTAPDLAGKQNVTSYFIVDPTKINTTTTAYATAGGTGVPLPLSQNPKDLVATIGDVFKQVLSVSTTFVAASVPVNVFNRAEVVDNVYIALFQPDAAARPYWNGNVKKLKVQGLNESNPVLVDAAGQPAVAADGRLRFTAQTFWTDTAALPAPDLDENEVAGADGRAVHRGGAGQKIPGYLSGGPGTVNSSTTRRLFYDIGVPILPALNADAATAAVLQADLGAATIAEALALLKFARGLDVNDVDGDDDFDEARPWIMADPLHSRPLPLNYGARDGYSNTNQAIFIAVAGNDGLVHFIRNTTTAGAESGEEVWGFMPRSVMGKLATLRTNAASVPHPYLVDGSIVSYMADADNNGTIDTGEKAYLFFGYGRGDRAYTGLDVSDPVNPKLLWNISNSGDFSELGYSLAEPRVIRVNTGSGIKPALVLAGGYSLNKDTRPGVGTDDTYGNALYVVDAVTGALIWKAVGGSGSDSATVRYEADLVDSISATPAVLDSDGNGVHDRILVGDTGGNVWRADIAGPDTGDWKLTRLAALGRHSVMGATKADDRRFHHRPDVVQGNDEDGPYDAVIIGSGDRQDPLDKGGIASNWMYMIKDRNITPGSGQDTGLVHTDLGDVTETCVSPGGDCSADLGPGWRLALEYGGEKSLATPTTIGGTVYFTTYLPPGGSPEVTCSPAEGNGRLYAVSFKNAAARNNYDITTEELERFTDLTAQGIPAEIVSLPPTSILRPDLSIERTGAPTRFQTYWFGPEDTDL
jgi:type IV pilus assembly protein PilY1